MKSTAALGAWLHLRCGLSRAATNVALTIVGMIIGAAYLLGRLSRSISYDLPAPVLARDVRAGIDRLRLTPTIRRTIVCLGCHKTYDEDGVPRYAPGERPSTRRPATLSSSSSVPTTTNSSRVAATSPSRLSIGSSSFSPFRTSRICSTAPSPMPLIPTLCATFGIARPG